MLRMNTSLTAIGLSFALNACSTPSTPSTPESGDAPVAESAATHETKSHHDLYSVQEEWPGACKRGAELTERQSPIALADALFSKAKKQSMKFLYKPNDAEVVDNGHTLVVKFAGDAGKLVYEGKDFPLKQFHFHKVSEHTLNGKTYDMEAHFVHIGGEKPVKAIALGFLIEKGKSPADWQAFWDKIPEHGEHDPIADEDHQRTVATLKNFDVRSIIPKGAAYYTYEGSLTTPPCDEYVTHMVAKKPIAFSGPMIEKFAHYHEISNRKLQPLGDAKIRNYRNVSEN